MKSNSHIKFANIFDFSQLHFDSLARSLSIGRIDLPKILVDRGNIGNHKVQKSQLDRRHRSINWRWQSRLLNMVNQ